MYNKSGEKVEEPNEIKKAYKEFYEDLLKERPPITEEEKEKEKEINTVFEKIMEVAETQKPIQVTDEEVKPILSHLKKKKAKDKEGWRNEMLIEGGDEMVKSIRMMANQILDSEEHPSQWTNMIINSIHKKKDIKDLKNKRGLFLTNILSKAFEKIVESRTSLEFDKGQCGGKKHRGPIDNWFLLIALRDTFKHLKKHTYLFFADLVKCFDKLWLKDCIVDIWKAGIREREAKTLYLLNKKAKIWIKTPVGMTESIEVNEVVKQGTVFAVKLCCSTTGEVNHIGPRPITVINPKINTGAVIFVDDIMGGGNSGPVRGVMTNCVKMETQKKMEFSTEKSNWMVMKTGKRNEQVEELDVEIKQGKIPQTDEYKYLGNWANEEGNMDKQLEVMEKRVGGVAREANLIGSYENVGDMEVVVKLLLYESTMVPTIFYNMEAWTNMRVADKQRLEVMQGKLLKKILRLPKSTPYWGLLSELGIWPVEWKINYWKLMLLHNLLHSDDDRLAKLILIEQKRSAQPNCWYSEIKTVIETLQIKQDPESTSKQEWKTATKGAIQEKVIAEAKEKIKGMKKLRFVKNFGQKPYITEMTAHETIETLRLRLNMTMYIAGNIGKEELCQVCKKEKQTTEHVFDCTGLQNCNNLTTDSLQSTETEVLRKTLKLFQGYEKKREEELLRAASELVESAAKKVGGRKRIVKGHKEGDDGEGLKIREGAVKELIKGMD